MKKSKKLLKFVLDDGTGTDRVILSGIHDYYAPEELVGKTCIAITNLPPRPMMGIDSCGMLISAVHHEDGQEMYDELEGAVSLVLKLPGYDRWEESLIQMYVIQTMVLYEFLHENDIQVEKYLGVYKGIIDCHEDADRVRSALELQYSARLYDFCEEMMELYFTE